MDKKALKKNMDQVLQPNKTEGKMIRFTYLSTTMALNKEEKEEKRPTQLGNTVINDIF